MIKKNSLAAANALRWNARTGPYDGPMTMNGTQFFGKQWTAMTNGLKRSRWIQATI